MTVLNLTLEGSLILGWLVEVVLFTTVVVVVLFATVVVVVLFATVVPAGLMRGMGTASGAG